MRQDESLILVSRDNLRDAMVTQFDEAHMTYVMGAIARMLLGFGYSVVIHAWNLEPMDRALWVGVSQQTGSVIEWIDVPEWYDTHGLVT